MDHKKTGLVGDFRWLVWVLSVPSDAVGWIMGRASWFLSSTCFEIENLGIIGKNISKLYPNLLAYFDRSVSNMAKRQHIQTTATSIVLNTQRLFPSQKLLRRLHWLPAYFRINYRIATLNYKVLTFSQPLHCDISLTYWFLTLLTILLVRKKNTSSHSLQFLPS